MGSRVFIWDVSASLSPVPPGEIYLLADRVSACFPLNKPFREKILSFGYPCEHSCSFQRFGLKYCWLKHSDCCYHRANGQDWEAELRENRRPSSGVTVSVVAALWNPWGTSGSLGLRKWLQPNRRFSFKKRVREVLMCWASWGFAKLNWTREFLLTFHFTLIFCCIHVLVEFVTTCKFPLRQTKCSSTSTDHTVQSTLVLWTKSTCQSLLPGLFCPSPMCDSKGCAPRQTLVRVRGGECYLLCFNFLK